MKELRILIIATAIFATSFTDAINISDIQSDSSELMERSVLLDQTEADSSRKNGEHIESMLEEDILFNGKLNRHFEIKEFAKVFGKADSIQLIRDQEELCFYIFNERDGNKDKEDKFLYKDGSCFENSKQQVAVDEFRFSKTNFILFKGTTLNSSTTVADLRKLFPNAVKHIEPINVQGEEELQVIQLSEGGISEGHVNLFIKNGKLYYMHWWFPC